MNVMVWIWLAIAVGALVVEISTPQFVSIWFSLSGMICLALSFIPGLSWWAQIIIFAVLSCALLFALRPICRKYLIKKEVPTNADSLIGREVRMITEANFDQLGQAKVGDVVWSVKAQDENDVLPQGEIVIIVAIDGNKLIATHK